MAAAAKILLIDDDPGSCEGLSLLLRRRAAAWIDTSDLRLSWPMIKRIVRLVIIAAAFLVVLNAWGIGAIAWVTEGSGRVIVGALLNVLAILIVALITVGVVGPLGPDAGIDKGGATRAPRVQVHVARAVRGLQVGAAGKAKGIAPAATVQDRPASGCQGSFVVAHDVGRGVV